MLPTTAVGQTQTTGSGEQQTIAETSTSSIKMRFGVEYWVRGSWRGNFDFDSSKDDGWPFAWSRVKPLFAVEGRRFDIVLQGQDSRSGGVPTFLPNGTLSQPTYVRPLDFIKAYVRYSPTPNWSLKVGREQGDGTEIGIARRLVSSTNYGTVLKSFDMVALKWQTPRQSVMGFVSRPDDNLAGTLSKPRPGELFWGVQADTQGARNLHRVYFVTKSIAKDIVPGENGVLGTATTYAAGIQENGKVLVPGIVWDIDAMYQWGHRSADSLSAWALFVNGTHIFSKDHTVFAGYHEASGDGRRGDGTSHLYDIFYASGYNEYGYMGLTYGRNLRHIRIGGKSTIYGPLSLTWNYHDTYVESLADKWYAIFTPDIARPNATSSHLGQEINATFNLKFDAIKHATFAVGYLGFVPGAYLTSTGLHTNPQQWTIDVFGGF